MEYCDKERCSSCGGKCCIRFLETFKTSRQLKNCPTRVALHKIYPSIYDAERAWQNGSAKEQIIYRDELRERCINPTMCEY